MIIVRMIKDGISEHFPMRVSEWVMLWPTMGMWLAFQVQPDVFQKYPSLQVLAQWAEEETWAAVCLICGILRLIALVINGTFKAQFPYTPHLRVVAAFMSIVFWSQLSLGCLISFLEGHGAVTAVVTYTSLCVFELVNLHRSVADATEMHLRKSRTDS